MYTKGAKAESDFTQLFSQHTSILFYSRESLTLWLNGLKTHLPSKQPEHNEKTHSKHEAGSTTSDCLPLRPTQPRQITKCSVLLILTPTWLKSLMLVTLLGPGWVQICAVASETMGGPKISHCVLSPRFSPPSFLPSLLFLHPNKLELHFGLYQLFSCGHNETSLLHLDSCCHFSIFKH